MSNNIYDAYTDEQLRDALKEGEIYLRWSRNLWIVWDDDKQDRVEKQVGDITRELRTRQAAKLNKEVYT